jgi:hypothetical protein
MQTISHIRYDNNVYSQVNHGFLLLYQMNGPSVFIPLPNAHLLSFIQTFDNIYHCQNYINTNNGIKFTLFVYSENIKSWIDGNNPIPDNLHEIIIFCPNSDDQAYFNDWADRLRQVKDIITYDELDHKSLLSGIKHIKKIRSSFQGNQGLLNLLKEDYRRMCEALSNYFIYEANIRDHRVAVGVETS